MRVVCLAAVRSVLVPAILALAWFIWGAAAAEASTLDAGPAGIASGAASDLITSPAAKPLRAAPVVPGIPNLKAPVATTVSTVPVTADSVTGTANAAVGTEADTADAVIGEAAAVVVTTVTKTAAPVLTEVDKVIDVVEGAVHSVPPVISVPSVPGTVGTAPGNAPEAAAADKAQAAPSLGTKSEGSSLAPATAAQPLVAAGRSLAQLLMTTPHRPESAGAVQAPMGLPDAPQHQEPLASLAEGHSGSGSSGSVGSGVQAADVAGSWSGMHLGAGARTHDANQSVPAGPAFDPGSSPD
ncbi:hypothetical protein ASG92_22670 [Arthrobacter sp. Soil736]|uniref:hypothetical protein n=1 Tax=Arthrobacter sp. Soil736 TaxID=1736395 RepID=UPI0006F9CF01|nr:hypothetical protein [Arthrobacter sp. Soil736]KRE59331.1 hypothetical protein ASG92_22670 [Arthrobacter sp. Soil736]